MLYTRYEIIYFQRKGPDDTNTDVSLMGCHQTGGTSMAFMMNRFESWKTGANEGENFIYQMFLIKNVLDTGNTYMSNEIISKWTKVDKPTVMVKYNEYEEPKGLVNKATISKDYFALFNKPVEYIEDEPEDSPEDHHEHDEL